MSRNTGHLHKMTKWESWPGLSPALRHLWFRDKVVVSRRESYKGDSQDANFKDNQVTNQLGLPTFWLDGNSFRL